MKVTVSFANPFLATIYAVSLLLIGWAIGAHWGHTVTAGWMLLISTIFMLVHDAVIATLLGIAAAKVASSGKK
jgi:hypothetical protein